MTVTVSLENGLQTTAKVGHHTWHADEPLDSGGTDTAPTPMQQLLGSLGGCIAITVKLYADRKQWPLEKIEVELDIQRFNAPDYAAYKGDAQFVHEIREKVVLHGPLSDDQRARLMEIATKCPVRRVLSNPAFFVESEKVTAP